jgi:uncharacterized protein (TIGR00369 family)
VLRNWKLPDAGNKTMNEQSTLAHWLADEARLMALRSHGEEPGIASAQDLAKRSGLELMQAMLRAEVPPPAIAKTLSFMLVEVDAGRAVFQGRPGAAHTNPLGTIHGGWYATLLDSALGCCVHTMLPKGRAYTTAELSVNLVRAIPSQVTVVRAEGKVIHCGRQLATAEARLFGPDGTLYAHGTTTCLVFELRN